METNQCHRQEGSITLWAGAAWFSPAMGPEAGLVFSFTSEKFHVAGNTSLYKDFWVPVSFHQDNSWSKATRYLLILARMCCSNSDSGEKEKKEGVGDL